MRNNFEFKNTHAKKKYPKSNFKKVKMHNASSNFETAMQFLPEYSYTVVPGYMKPPGAQQSAFI